MKLKHIYDMADTCCEFMHQVINQAESLDYDVLMKRIDMVCNACTEHGDDTIDIDYKNMCFTVHLNTVLGQWELCENASYYIYKNGFLDEDDGIIDIELF